MEACHAHQLVLPPNERNPGVSLHTGTHSDLWFRVLRFSGAVRERLQEAVTGANLVASCLINEERKLF